MPRDRHEEFLRKSANQNNNHINIELPKESFSEVPLLENAEESVNLESFFNKVEDVRSILKSIDEKVVNSKKIHVSIITSPQVDPNLNKTLDALQMEILQLSKTVTQSLRDMQNAIQNDEKVNRELEKAGKRKLHWADLRMKHTQYSTLKNQFKEIMERCNEDQVQYKEQCIDRAQRAIKIAGREMTKDEIEDAIETGDTQIFTQSYLHDTEMERANLRAIEERHIDLLKLEKSIVEMNKMFQEIATLVETQGEQIDKIEDHVAKTVDYAKAAVVETEKTVMYGNKTRRKKLYILMCIIIAVIILAIIITLSIVL